MNDSTTAAEQQSKAETVLVDVGSLANESLSKIIGLSHMALAAMETKQAYRNPEMLAQAFASIFGIAEQAREIIGCMAEGVGGYREDCGDLLKRFDASREAMKEAFRTEKKISKTLS